MRRADQGQSSVVGRADELRRVLKVDRHRFLDEDMLAGAQGGQCDLRVLWHRGDDQDGVHIRIADDIGNIGRKRDPGAKVSLHPLGSARLDVARPHDTQSALGSQVADHRAVRLEDTAQADDPKIQDVGHVDSISEVVPPGRRATTTRRCGREIAEMDQPFTDPPVRPRTKYRWSVKNTSIGTTIVMKAPAVSRFQS
jgi:hypothetical protein